jgi:hypothetical protein
MGLTSPHEAAEDRELRGPILVNAELEAIFEPQLCKVRQKAEGGRKGPQLGAGSQVQAA